MSRNNMAISLIHELINKHNTKVKFILVGIWNAIFGYLVFFLLDSLFINLFTKRYFAYLSAMILGQIIATINAFIFHKYITFKSKVKGRGIIIEFLRFCLTYVVTFCLSLILLPFFAEVFTIQPKVSALIVILICAVISYFGHLKFSFNLYK
ncbi:GtrA family protein [Bacteroidota bacterium]